jgi:hypothetical protein
VDQARGKASLEASSAPHGATVLVDGRRVGKTPLTFRGVTPGRHLVQLALPGYATWQSHLLFRSGKKSAAHARLRGTSLLSAEEKTVRRSAAASGTARLRALAVLGLLSRSPILSTLLRPGDASAPGLPGQDPISGLFVTAAAAVQDGGTVVVTLSYFLDPGHSQPAGSLVLLLDGSQQVVDFRFTAGSLEGASGHLVGRTAGADTTTLSGTVTLPDETTAAVQLRLILSDPDLILTGAVDAASPDGTASHFELTAAGRGTDFHITTGTDLTLDVHVSRNGSGMGTLSRTESRLVLATFAFAEDGSATLVFPDGTTETFHVELGSLNG